jgi:glutaminyl-peptide cyclotransferase
VIVSLKRLRIAGALAVLLFFATACNGGVRPTITNDRLDAATESNVEESAAANDQSAAGDAGTSTDQATAADSSQTNVDDALATETEGVEALTVEILETLPHDPEAFTQGLEIHNGQFIESTGVYGQSDLRRVEPATGEVLRLVPIAEEFFAEGLTRVDDQYIQLTWQENTAFYWDSLSLSIQKEVSYEGEGWGLCYDGEQLIMTDGKPELIFRDPESFDETGRVSVTLNGQDVFNLNEVECVDGVVWANIWQSDAIVRIDPATGNVTATVDASSLPGPEPADPNAVLNGIAWDETTQSFYVTGKLWPNIFRVNFVPVAG